MQLNLSFVISGPVISIGEAFSLFAKTLSLSITHTHKTHTHTHTKRERERERERNSILVSPKHISPIPIVFSLPHTHTIHIPFLHTYTLSHSFLCTHDPFLKHTIPIPTPFLKTLIHDTPLPHFLSYNRKYKLSFNLPYRQYHIPFIPHTCVLTRTHTYYVSGRYCERR